MGVPKEPGGLGGAWRLGPGESKLVRMPEKMSVAAKISSSLVFGGGREWKLPLGLPSSLSARFMEARIRWRSSCKPESRCSGHFPESVILGAAGVEPLISPALASKLAPLMGLGTEILFSVSLWATSSLLWGLGCRSE